MRTVTVSPKFQVVIPKDIRDTLGLRPGQKMRVIEYDGRIAMNASKLSLQHNLPTVDRIILATAQAYKCIIWTQDSDFRDIEGVNYFSK